MTAGSTPHFTISRGSIARIATGAPIPAGADAVVMVEDSELVQASSDQREEKIVKIKRASRQGDNIRPRGSDIAVGEKVLDKGTELGPSEIGILASIGITEVLVHASPRVAVLSTGEEVAEFTTAVPGASQIRDSNKPTIVSILEQEGCPVVDLGIVGDKMADLEARIRIGLASADVLITYGGVSMGESDLLKHVLLSMNATIHFGRVAMKPGKPTTFATVVLPDTNEKKLIFSLPGNPVSSVVCFYLFVLPALRKMRGHQFADLPVVRVRLSQAVKLDSRPEYQRAFVQIHNSPEGTTFTALGTGKQASSRLLSMRTANALLKLPAGQYGESLMEGDVVDAILINNLRDFP